MKKKIQNTHRLLNVAKDTDFRITESFKALRTSIMFSLPASDEKRSRLILFTSPDSGDGKTTVSVNTAITLAETENKVLLIDADMRKPTVHRYFGIDSGKGLSNIVSGMNKKEECIIIPENMPNLSVVPSGILPSNPSELLGSSAMSRFLDECENEYDYIIIDTPPINVVADALSVVGRADGTAIVVSQGKSTYPEASKAVETLKFAGANILGIVFNRADGGKKHYGSYGSYGHAKYEI